MTNGVGAARSKFCSRASLNTFVSSSSMPHIWMLNSASGGASGTGPDPGLGGGVGSSRVEVLMPGIDQDRKDLAAGVSFGRAA